MRMDLVRLGQDYRSSISRIAEQGSIQQSEAIDRVQREASRVSAERLHATTASPPAREAALPTARCAPPGPATSPGTGRQS
jgi:MOSC domain-containing protein YiiM